MAVDVSWEFDEGGWFVGVDGACRGLSRRECKSVRRAVRTVSRCIGFVWELAMWLGRGGGGKFKNERCADEGTRAVIARHGQTRCVLRGEVMGVVWWEGGGTKGLGCHRWCQCGAGTGQQGALGYLECIFECLLRDRRRR